MNAKTVDTSIIDHLPDSYGLVDDLIPSDFRLVESKPKNPLLEYADAAAEEEADDLSKSDVQLDNDFEFVRNNLKKIIKDSAGVLENAAELANSSDSPQSIQAVSKLLDTITSMNAELLKTHESRARIKQMRKVQPATAQVTNQQNNYYVASPSEVIDRLRGGE